MGWYLLAAFLAVTAVIAGHFLSKGLYWLAALALGALVVGVVVQQRHDDVTTSGHEGDDDQGSGLVGGCPAFNVYAQNQFQPFGTLRWTAPEPTAGRSPGFSENELITLDGWVKAQSPYAGGNTPPWDADVWFHLADGSGWVTFAGVRAAATVPDPEGGFGPGSDPVPLDPTCQGTYRP